MPDTWYTTPEAAEYLGLTLAAIKGHLREKTLMPDVRKTRALLFKQSTLDAWRSRRRPVGYPKGRPRKEAA